MHELGHATIHIVHMSWVSPVLIAQETLTVAARKASGSHAGRFGFGCHLPAVIELPDQSRRPFSGVGSLDCLLVQVNDDFCDCMSGRDEPGTSACSQQGASFLCSDGKIAIPTSFLQDGFRYSC